jgi:hypothetical protein
VRKQVDPKWVLAGHYLSTIYWEAAVRGHKPIDLRVSNAAEFVGHLARGTEWDYSGCERGEKPAVKLPAERLTLAFLALIWSHGRKHNADDRVDMERLADRFLDEHRALFAELALTPGDPAKVNA